jgi:hypothetical protein
MARAREGTAITHPYLVTAAPAILESHRQVEESLRAGFSSALAHAIEAGRKLAYAKSLVGHGGWGAWLEQNLADIDSRTERLYRQLAEAADDGRLPTGNAVTTLSIRRARELLAQAATADEAEDGTEHRQSSAGAESLRWDAEARRLARNLAGLLASSRKLFGGPNFKRAGGELYDALADLYGDEDALEVIEELGEVTSSARAHARKVAQVD